MSAFLHSCWPFRLPLIGTCFLFNLVLLATRKGSSFHFLKRWGQDAEDGQDFFVLEKIVPHTPFLLPHPHSPLPPPTHTHTRECTFSVCPRNEPQSIQVKVIKSSFKYKKRPWQCYDIYWGFWQREVQNRMTRDNGISPHVEEYWNKSDLFLLQSLDLHAFICKGRAKENPASATANSACIHKFTGRIMLCLLVILLIKDKMGIRCTGLPDLLLLVKVNINDSRDCHNKFGFNVGPTYFKYYIIQCICTQLFVTASLVNLFLAFLPTV